MTPDLEAIAAVVVFALTAALKLIPGLKAAPWHTALIRLAAVTFAAGIIAAMAYSKGELAALDWPTILPVLGSAAMAFLAAVGLFELTPAALKGKSET